MQPKRPDEAPANFTVAHEPVSGKRKRSAVKRDDELLMPNKPFTITIAAGGKTVTIAISEADLAEASDPGPAKWLVDANGKIVWSNVDKKILGIRWSSKEVPWHVVHPDDRERVQREWKLVLRNQSPRFAMRYRVERSDGTYVEVRHDGERVMNEGEVCGYKGTMAIVSSSSGGEGEDVGQPRRKR